jgi:hypothetical protein
VLGALPHLAPDSTPEGATHSSPPTEREAPEAPLRARGGGGGEGSRSGGGGGDSHVDTHTHAQVTGDGREKECASARGGGGGHALWGGGGCASANRLLSAVRELQEREAWPQAAVEYVAQVRQYLYFCTSKASKLSAGDASMHTELNLWRCSP